MRVILNHHPRLHHNSGPPDETITLFRRLVVDYRKVQHLFTLYGTAAAAVCVQLSRELPTLVLQAVTGQRGLALLRKQTLFRFTILGRTA